MANATAETDRSEGLKALESAVGQLRKKYGTGTVMRADEGIIGDVEVIPTGILPLDVALGVGGLPVGRIVEIFGPESSGKTTLCYEIMANAQRAGGMCAFIDTEHAMDKLYAEAVGVKTDELYVSQPDNGEQAIDVAETLLCSGALSVIVIDSVAALVPKAELEGEMGDSLPGVQARLMSKACRRLSILANQHNTLIIFTNQLREKIGVMFGSPEVTTGGRALKFYASVRLDIRRIETLKEGTDSVANRTRVKTVKNKVAPPFQQAEFEIIFGEGADRVGSMIDLGVEVGKIEKAGAFFTLPNGDKVQGRAKTREYLKEHPEVATEIEAAIRAVKLPDKVELPPFELGEVMAETPETASTGTEAPAPALASA